MMNDYADLTAAPMLLKAGGREWEVSPLTDADLGQLLRLIQYHPWYELRELGDVPSEVVAETLQKCIATVISLDSPEFETASKTQWGMREVAFLSLRHKHPYIKRDDLGGWAVFDVSDAAGLAIVLTRVTNPSMPEDIKQKLVDAVGKLVASGRVKWFNDTKPESKLDSCPQT